MLMSNLQDHPTVLCPLLLKVFTELDQAEVHYCLLRGYEELLEGSVDGDVDLLVAADHFERVSGVLERLGFVALSRWGQTPHYFFIGYDQSEDRWVKLDLVTELAYGRPIPALRLALAAECLRNRIRYGPAFTLSVEDEILTLLLHCLLDKATFEPKYRIRLTALVREIKDEQYLISQVARYFPPAISWMQIKQRIEWGEWDTLLGTRHAIVQHLVRRDLPGTNWRRVSRSLLRFLDRKTRKIRTRGIAVALLAPDGAGKTTLARALGHKFYLPTRYVYMGTNLNTNAIILPTTRWLTKANKGSRKPLVRLLNAVNSLVEQAVRYRVGAYHRGFGRLVIFDRYHSGSLSLEQRSGRIHKRLQQWMVRRLCPPPDMVVYLDAPAEVLYQRKQEHSPEILEQQRRRYLGLLQGHPQAVVVDAGLEPERVRREVTAVIWRRYADHLRKSS